MNPRNDIDDMTRETEHPKTYVALLFLSVAGLVFSLLTYFFGTWKY